MESVKLITSNAQAYVKDISKYLDYFNIVLVKEQSELGKDDVKDLKQIEDLLSQAYKVLRNISLRR